MMTADQRWQVAVESARRGPIAKFGQVFGAHESAGARYNEIFAAAQKAVPDLTIGEFDGFVRELDEQSEG